MDISGNTKVCAIIGDPVEHSVSPAMHNAAFKELGLDYVYIPFRVYPSGLEEALAGLKALNITGFNVTIPHKVNIIPLLDKIDPLAGKIGAVNTVLLQKTPGTFANEITGYNTDAPGFLRALSEHGFKPEGKKIVLLGAGGAARAISYILAEHHAGLTILNRRGTVDWAENLGKEVKVMALDRAAEALEGAGLLINATSVGMTPADNTSPVPAKVLGKVPLVFDIVYNPAETRLLKDAKEAGVKTISGLEMLVWQGALAFELWTGCKAPVEIMRREVLKMLGKA